MSKLYRNREHQRQIKRNESVVVYNDENYKVIVPLTHRVSRIYGSGTKWCTSIGHFGEFERYLKSGVIYYILSKGVPQGVSNYKVAAFKPFEFVLPFKVFYPDVDSYIEKVSNKEYWKDKYIKGGNFVRGSKEFSEYYLDLGKEDKVYYLHKLTNDVEFFLSDDAHHIVDMPVFVNKEMYLSMINYYKELENGIK